MSTRLWSDEAACWVRVAAWESGRSDELADALATRHVTREGRASRSDVGAAVSALRAPAHRCTMRASVIADASAMRWLGARVPALTHFQDLLESLRVPAVASASRGGRAHAGSRRERLAGYGQTAHMRSNVPGPYSFSCVSYVSYSPRDCGLDVCPSRSVDSLSKQLPGAPAALGALGALGVQIVAVCRRTRVPCL